MDTAEESIRRLAYALWEARGRPSGSPEVDWETATREVTGKLPPIDADHAPIGHSTPSSGGVTKPVVTEDTEGNPGGVHIDTDAWQRGPGANPEPAPSPISPEVPSTRKFKLPEPSPTVDPGARSGGLIDENSTP